MRPLRPDDFVVAWICALPHELAASRAMLDEIFEAPKHHGRGDENTYTFGRIAGHYVVMSCLPAGKYGLVSAGIVAKDLKRSFPSVRYGLMVGIGGGIPTIDNDIRLGDVVVSKPTDGHSGVVQYDMGKILADGTFERRGHLNEPPPLMLSAIPKLQAIHEAQAPRISEFLEEAFTKFPKLREKYSRPADAEQGRPLPTPDAQPMVHYGLIASGNRVIASKEDTDRLLMENKGILCVEMEAAGLMNTFPFIVIRGICDYADVHKLDTWQRYAAITAAAFAKEFLCEVPVLDRPQPDITEENYKTVPSKCVRLTNEPISQHGLGKSPSSNRSIVNQQDYRNRAMASGKITRSASRRYGSKNVPALASTRDNEHTDRELTSPEHTGMTGKDSDRGASHHPTTTALDHPCRNSAESGDLSADHGFELITPQPSRNHSEASLSDGEFDERADSLLLPNKSERKALQKSTKRNIRDSYSNVILRSRSKRSVNRQPSPFQLTPSTSTLSSGTRHPRKLADSGFTDPPAER